jgi:hypothetical protein
MEQSHRSTAAVEGRVAGWEESPETEKRDREMVPCLGLGRGKDFLKTDYGRTGQSTVLVRCTPDSAQ